MFLKKKQLILIVAFLLLFVLPLNLSAQYTVTLENISRVEGVRENQLRGYGLVVGLDGTGDGGIEFVNRSIANALDRHGINVQNPEEASLDNVAAVMVTATLPPFKKSGDKIDVTVSSLGSAGDLSGGVLLETPLQAGNEKVYAVAQGAVSKGGDDDELHATTVSIPEGALVEKDVSFDFVGEDGKVSLQLDRGNFTTASRAAEAINAHFNRKLARAKNANTVDIQVPEEKSNDVAGFISTVQNLEVEPSSRSRVVVNERTGTVIMGENITVRPVAITHRDISIQIDGDEEDESTSGESVKLPELTTVDEVVNSLNSVGASTDDVISILQSLHRADAITAPLEVM